MKSQHWEGLRNMQVLSLEWMINDEYWEWKWTGMYSRGIYSQSEYVGSNVPLDTLQVISGTIFTGQMTKPTVSKSTEGNQLVVKIRLESHQIRTTPRYNNTILGNRLYAQRKGPDVTNPICWTCKNCSYKCAADCEDCVTQSSIELFW